MARKNGIETTTARPESTTAPSPLDPRKAWRRGFIVASALGVIACMIVATAYKASARVGARPITAIRRRCNPGPWGELEYVPLQLEPPDSFVSTERYLEYGSKWSFKNQTRESLAAFLTSCGLDEKQSRTILQDVVSDFHGACVVKPDPDVILNLDSAVRAKLYDALAKDRSNFAQYDPFVSDSETLTKWLAESKLSKETLALLNRLLYRRGESVLLADYGLVLSRIPSDAERLRLLKMLLRRPSMMMKLRIKPETDIEALAAYWGRGGRDSAQIGQIEALLKGMPKIEDGITVGIDLLLPHFARERLYTYPEPSDDPVAEHRDCHWTSLNFFSEQPDDRFTTEQNVVSTLKSKYAPIQGKPIFGDILMLVTKDGQLIHTAVYIADDIYFTKNGAGPASPWMLMHLEDILSVFKTHELQEPTYYRYSGS